MNDPANLPCNHAFCHDCIVESLKGRKTCPLCQRRSVKKNNVLANVVVCYQAMDELVHGGPTASGTPRTSAHSTPIKASARAEEVHDAIDQDTASQSTLAEIVELKRQLRDQERAIAEIDTLLSETNHASVTNGTARGTKRKSAPTPASVLSQDLSAVASALKKRARVDEDEEQQTYAGDSEKAQRGGEQDEANGDGMAEDDEEGEDNGRAESEIKDGEEEEDKPTKDKQPGKRKGQATSKEKQPSPEKKQRNQKKDTKETKGSPPSSATRFVLLGTGLDAQKTRKLRRLASKHGGKVVGNFTNNVTHIVTPDENCTARRTLKFMLGLLNGMWIVNFAWVTASLDAGKYVNEEPFEITSDTVGKGGPAKGRKSAGGSALFEGYSFYLHGSFQAPSPSKDDLKTLITTAGGTFLSRSPPSPVKANKRGRKNKSVESDEPSAPSVVADGEDNGRTMVLCDVGCSAKQAKEARQMCGRLPVSVLWLLDSISHFKPQPLETYVLGSTNNEQ